MSAARPSPHRPLSVAACDGMVLSFAGWTVLCNAVVLFEGTVHDLLVAASVAIVLTVIVRRRLVRSPQRGDGDAASSAVASEAALEPATNDGGIAARPSPRARIVAATAAAALTVAYLASERFELVWWLTIGYFLVALLQAPMTRCGVPFASRRWEQALWFLALCGALVPLLLHRHSPDDSFYLNVVAHAAAEPGEPPLQYDTMHGIPDFPLLTATYKAHGHELLAGVVTYLSGLSAIQVYQWILPSLFGLFIALGSARLLRFLAPDRWLLCVAVAGVSLVLLSESMQSHGSFSLLRLQQGKGVFAAVFVPLLLAYGLEYARRPSARTWWLLFAVQVAAMGVTATAIWAGPVLCTLAMVAASPWTVRSLRTVALGMAASSYVIAVGLSLAAATMSVVGENLLSGGEGISLIHFSSEPLHEGHRLIVESWKAVFGVGVVSAVSLFAALAAWIVCPGPVGRRVCILVPLGTALFFMNPYTSMEVASRVTGGPTYWRVLWLLPVPVLLALVFTVGVRSRAAAAVSLGIVAWLTSWVVSDRGFLDARWEAFGLKVDHEAYAHACEVNANVAPGSAVAAAVRVATWIPTMRGHAYPLVPRRSYLLIMKSHFDDGEVERRQELQRYVSGHPGDAGPQLLTDAVRHYDLAGVSFRLGRRDKEIRRALRPLGFRKVYESERYETWAKSEP